MWIKSLVVLCVIGIICSISAVEITGFRDIKWGDSPKALGSNAVRYSENKVEIITHYERKDEKLMIGNVKLSDIRYSFFNNKLMSISISLSDAKDKAKIVDIFKIKYGPYNGIEYQWVDRDNSSILIMPDFIIMKSGAIDKESKDYLKQKSVNDL